ncbi:hypothetical protein, partial [Bartonella sp. AP58NXGY]|uniref:hypothetical protein n=1 Tax=Bartonella sp. AP58NXGY TaxID=3243498 RepID=UPI0035CF5217
MINVFKKRTRLYALTTSALFLLQGADVSMGAGWSFLLPSFSLPSGLPLLNLFNGSSSTGAREGDTSRQGSQESEVSNPMSVTVQSHSQPQPRVVSVSSRIQPISACYSRKNNDFIPGVIKSVAGRERISGGVA